MDTTDRSTGVERATGRDRPEWFSLLDAWAAAGRPYAEIRDWLMGEHGLNSWWAQKIIVEYEESRGVRDPGARRDGMFEVGASKTVDARPKQVLAAFRDADQRARWLPKSTLAERDTRSTASIQFDWGTDGSRVAVTSQPTSSGKTLVSVQHTHLPDADSARAMKAHWRERLSALQQLLEA